MPPIHAPHTGNHPSETASPGQWLAAFNQHARLHPDRIALVCGRRTVSYGELWLRTERLAGKLEAEGIGAGTYVGIGLHRSAELIWAMLGILKAGAAYIPLDPSYPQERILRMIASARLETVITTPELAAFFPGVGTIFPDSAAGPAPTLPAHAGGDGQSPVYAIFTSGSTGQPKAASVFHSGFANLLEWYGEELRLGADDRTLVISSPSFDLTQKNLFAPLLRGGRIILDDCLAYDITRITGLIREHGVTLVNCTPSAFYPIVEAAAANGYREISSLRFAVLGGEAISIPRLRAWLEHPSCRAEVVNSYGPTECTDICLFHRLHRGNLDAFGFVPLGREIPNVTVSIRGEDLAPLPDGETGELCIGGAGVGGGYLHDPERTADRFVGGIYRTGDLAKRLPCGTYEFRGRADHQVKVNGFRIELAEIEIALQDHESVREAVVTAHGDRLVAHVQGDAGAADLRAHLSTRLPAYMIPSEFVSVEKFPLTPNGKVDRKSLRDSMQAGPVEDLVANDASLESRILSLWSGILGRTLTDPAANFFDLGGNSIHLAVVHVRLREMTGRDFPITDLFARPSARSLAAHLGPRQDSAAAPSALDRARLAKSGLTRFQRPLKR
jgi:amino acid adenylation domain-containing protein